MTKRPDSAAATKRPGSAAATMRLEQVHRPRGAPALASSPAAALAVALFSAALAVAPLACSKGTQSLCTSDVQCAQGFSCDPSTGACRCSADSACAATETCNAAGFCQPRLRCQGTADCAAGSICDSQSGSCIPAETCTQDVQCAPGQVCQNYNCVAGCRHSGDCALGKVCRDCPPGTAAADCPAGKQCVLGSCDSQVSCPYGDFCAADPASPSGQKVCRADPRPFCAPCSRQAGEPYYCPGGQANYCLIDSSKPLGQAFFCGVDCSQQTACPNGYQCRDVRIVTAQNCAPSDGLSACPATRTVTCDPAHNHAPADGSPGIVNDDCEAAQPPLVGAVCDPKRNKCVPQCLGTGEAGVQAFCSCIRDEDCPQDVCDSSTRACLISGKPCIVGAVPDQCQSTHKIYCVKSTDPRLGAVGYCKIGQNCAPAEGFTCDRLRAGQ